MTTLLMSSALALTGGGLWRLFRRQAPRVKTEDLPPGVDESIQVVLRLTKEERIAAKAVFLAGDDFAWMVGGKHFKTNLNEKQHTQATFYMLECVLTFAEHFGHIFVSRDTDGKFLGALALIPPYTNSLLFMIHFCLSVTPLGVPAPVQMGKDVAARFDAFSQGTADCHKELMKETPHWHVQVLGVSNDAQGKGVGRKLMSAATAAIAGETPLYLECHDGNVEFYKNMGYDLNLYQKELKIRRPFRTTAWFIA